MGKLAQSDLPSLLPSRSWMAPDAKTKDLVYVSDYNANIVYVLSYPQLTLEGEIKGEGLTPIGLCTDAKQNVWVAYSFTELLREYAHGGTSPIATLYMKTAGSPNGCSVDPSTGDLAVTVLGYSSDGDVAIFKRAQGTPKIYTYSGGAFYAQFCGYDDKGNLFVDASVRTSGFSFLFAELPKGGSALQKIVLTGGRVYFPGQVQWDGKYVTVTDQYYQNQDQPGIYRTTGAGGEIVGSTSLDAVGRVAQLWIEGATVVVPNQTQASVELFKYPGGGLVQSVGGFDRPIGATVSLAK